MINVLRIIYLYAIISLFLQANSCTNTAEVTYTIVVRDTCSDAEVTIPSGSMRHYNIPYTMNCTNIIIIASNSHGMSPNHSVNTTSPSEPVYHNI